MILKAKAFLGPFYAIAQKETPPSKNDSHPSPVESGQRYANERVGQVAHPK